MVSKNVKPEAGKSQGPRIPTKPLPQILDEMDDNIRAAAEAAQRAEEAAREARSAAEIATKASERAGTSAEEAHIAAEVAQRSLEGTARKPEEADKGAMRKYLVIFEKANTNYSAYSPDLPGCIATGKTRKEVEKNIREAIAFHIEGLVKDGQPVPEPSSFTEYVEV